MAWTDIDIKLHYQLENTFNADYIRIAQLLSNILAMQSAMEKKGNQFWLNSMKMMDQFTLQFPKMRGEKIPEHILLHLFKPFSRGKVKPGQEGLGLGLYISNEIALAHGGSITVKSDETVTSFMISFPA